MQLKQVSQSQVTSVLNHDEFLISEYDPNNDDTSIDVWVMRIDRLVERYLWDDANMRFIAKRLKGIARQ